MARVQDGQPSGEVDANLGANLEDDLETNSSPPVWWDDVREDWRTRFPPPEGFDGIECGNYGDLHYSRELADDEADVLDALRRDAIEERREAEAAERERFFGFDLSDEEDEAAAVQGVERSPEDDTLPETTGARSSRKRGAATGETSA